MPPMLTMKALGAEAARATQGQAGAPMKPRTIETISPPRASGRSPPRARNSRDHEEKQK